MEKFGEPKFEVGKKKAEREREDQERDEALQIVRREIQFLRENPNCSDKSRWAAVQTICLFWSHLTDPYAEGIHFYYDPEVWESEEEWEEDKKKGLEADYISILQELEISDEELKQLFGGHTWGFYPGEPSKTSV